MYPNSTMWLVWDKKLARELGNPRKEILGEYKVSRDSSMARDVFKNSDVVERLTSQLGIRNFYPRRLEADDCISWLSRFGESIIFSADEDMAQLVNPNVSVYNLNKKKLFTHENFETEYGMTPAQFVLFKSIMGDSSDEIAGIPGYGKVKSKKLALKWGSVKVEKSIQTLVDHNIKLIDLIDNAFLDEKEIECYQKQYDNFENNCPTDFALFESELKEMALRTQLKFIGDWRRLFNSQSNNSSELRDILSSLDILK